MLFLLLLFRLVQSLDVTTPGLGECEELVLVETIPDNLTFTDPVSNLPTTAALLKLIDLAEDELNIAEFYFSLRPDHPPGTYFVFSLSNHKDLSHLYTIMQLRCLFFSNPFP